MALSTLSTLSTKTFWGGSYLTGSSSSNLVGLLNTIIARINQVIPLVNGTSELDALLVGDSTNYYLTGDTWLVVDGVNPPTVAAMRFQDTVDGTFKTVTVASGSLAVA